MHGRISPRRACNPCGYKMKMSSRYHRLLIYDVKRTTKIDGMGPLIISGSYGGHRRHTSCHGQRHRYGISHRNYLHICITNEQPDSQYALHQREPRVPGFLQGTSNPTSYG